MINQKVACFHKLAEGKHIALYDSLGIYRVMFRGGKHLAIFEALPDKLSVLPPLDKGLIEVRYIEAGPLDNPHNGHLLMTIEILEEKDAWINKLSPLEYGDYQVIMVRFMVRCKITWGESYSWQLYREIENENQAN